MARVNVYLPDDLAERARKADLNVSALTRRAIEDELAGQETNEWLARISTRSYGVSHDQVIAALDAVRDENGW